MWEIPWGWRDELLLDIKEVWCWKYGSMENSMMSLSNHVLVLVPIEGRNTIQLGGFKNTRKLEVEIMISCPMIRSRTTSDEMGHKPQAPGPTKKQAHSCWRKNPGSGYTFVDRRSYRIYAKPESCEGTIDGCLACRINGLFRTWFVDERNSAMLVRMTECYNARFAKLYTW